AWQAIAADCIHPTGFLGYVQGTGSQPADSQPVTYDGVPDFEDYGTGCFLLGATEYYRYIKGQRSKN
ncbi:MAG: glycoside hydrolase family 88 protein, partial [Prevotella sp.]|nr:glycoside hydrolase family 88 protein [Prevotella sp.]